MSPRPATDNLILPPVGITTPFKLGVLLFSNYDNQLMVFMEIARNLRNEPDRWKLPQRDFTDPTQPLREAMFDMVRKAYDLGEGEVGFYNSLPNAIHEQLPEDAVRSKERDHTITHWTAARCAEPYAHMEREGTRKWFPADAVQHCWQSYREANYLQVMRQVESQGWVARSGPKH